jgi:hypothetical protein
MNEDCPDCSRGAFCYTHRATPENVPENITPEMLEKQAEELASLCLQLAEKVYAELGNHAETRQKVIDRLRMVCQGIDAKYLTLGNVHDGLTTLLNELNSEQIAALAATRGQDGPFGKEPNGQE